MAKDVNDSVTMALIPEPKKRGRPTSGKALSNAERQRLFRERKKDRVQIDLSVDDWAKLSASLQALYEYDSCCSRQLQYVHLVEQIYRAGVKCNKMPDWFEENRYKGE